MLRLIDIEHGTSAVFGSFANRSDTHMLRYDPAPSRGMTKLRPLTAADQPASPADTTEASWSSDPPPPRHRLTCLSACIVWPFLAFGRGSALAYLSRQPLYPRLLGKNYYRTKYPDPKWRFRLLSTLSLKLSQVCIYIGRVCSGAATSEEALSEYIRGAVFVTYVGEPHAELVYLGFSSPSSCPHMTCVGPTA
jgi:hypothetical protein